MHAFLPRAQYFNDRTMKSTEPDLKKKLKNALNVMVKNPVEATVTTLSTATVRIEVLLRQPAGAQQVEPGRIVRIAEELASSIAKIVINGRAF
ncbi:MAG: hypothetical protein KAY73_04800 [Giesbergeria sp.]|nr:hypothetical protein [Giesbergeria sp.]